MKGIEFIKKLFKKFLKNKNVENSWEIYEGGIQNKDEISPTYINLNNPKYMEIDEVFYSGIIISNYNREYEYLILKNLINSNLNINISIFYEKKDNKRINLSYRKYGSRFK